MGKCILLSLYHLPQEKYVLDIEGNHSFENEMNYLLKGVGIAVDSDQGAGAYYGHGRRL